MERLTEKAGQSYAVPPEKLGEAVARLAQFEDMVDALVREREEISRELEALREQGKEKTVHFKELLARKLINTNLCQEMERYGLW